MRGRGKAFFDGRHEVSSEPMRTQLLRPHRCEVGASKNAYSKWGAEGLVQAAAHSPKQARTGELLQALCLSSCQGPSTHQSFLCSGTGTKCFYLPATCGEASYLIQGL